jgi:hypothetical protein
VIEWLGEGGVLEDQPSSLLDLYFNHARNNNHFHDPLETNWGLAGINDALLLPDPPLFNTLSWRWFNGQSLVLWAQNPNQQLGGSWSWQDARNYFYSALTSANKTQREEFFAKTFRAVGQQMHLVQDASVPEHVRNDIHTLFWQHYEAKVENIRNANPNLWNSWLSSPISFDKTILNSTSLTAPFGIPRIVDTNQYNGTNPQITVYSTIGLAEYTNANFLSPDTMFTDDFDRNHRHYFPYPRAATAYLWTDETYKRKYLKKDLEGENVDHLAVPSFWYFYRWRYFPKETQLLPIGLDDVCKEKYAQKLIPRAVGYSAGLLNYFFRGEMDMVADDVKGSGYVIVNNTDEDMSGQFELWYDNKKDGRVKVSGASWTLSISKKSSGNFFIWIFKEVYDINLSRY